MLKDNDDAVMVTNFILILCQSLIVTHFGEVPFQSQSFYGLLLFEIM